jgi:hypothetical protein
MLPTLTTVCAESDIRKNPSGCTWPVSIEELRMAGRMTNSIENDITNSLRDLPITGWSVGMESRFFPVLYSGYGRLIEQHRVPFKKKHIKFNGRRS